MIKHNSFNKIIQRDLGDSFVKILKTRNLGDLLKTLDNLSNRASDYGYSDVCIDDDIKLAKYKFMGDLFEIFAEAFFTQFSSDNRIGVFDYSPVSEDDDNGVDGFGKNIGGNPLTVQVKYRGDLTYSLKERDIKQFPYQSIINFNIDPKLDNNMIIFTNCSGLHWYTKSNVFCNKIRVINGDVISQLIDNNEGFWNGFKNLVIESVKNIGVDRLSTIVIDKLK
jgi:hypothetical protein